MINLLPLLQEIALQYTLDPADIHGLNHWGRVLENGLKLADMEGGDRVIIQLFAIFHDACRINQSIDPGHGSRGAVLAERLLGDLTQVTAHQLELLLQACREHTDGKTDADLTVKICWDADRLDLGRVNIVPDPRFLGTAAGKSLKIREWANQRAVANYEPPIVRKEWIPVFAKYYVPPRN